MLEALGMEHILPAAEVATSGREPGDPAGTCAYVAAP